MRTRIEDVARRAGVSPKTVSRVLNNEPNVREALRERILEAVKALGYRPNPSARSLASQRSFLVALLYDNPSPYYVMEVQGGVLDACDAQRYSMMVRPLPSGAPDFLERVEALLSQFRPDGLVLTPPIADHVALLALLAARGVPHARISPENRDAGVGATLDERAAAREMVRHLVALGHRRIAHITGHHAHGASGWRLRGYREGLAQAHLPYDPALVVEGLFSFDSGVAAAGRLFALRRRPTAVFAGNDDTAAGVMWAAAERGLAVPRDVSVCGFDDTPLSRQVWPSLTTVCQPSQDMGRIATQQLLRAIEGNAEGAMVSVPFALRLRRSTGPAPQRRRGRRD
ncbi:LacI family DNA-binding transcriptional regulator [Fulvimonas sp. R45]|uniref:LacI family DNA-binding transcriptional regulator n=1 Tax=Fulvimonas sp. R45 TaxID=3045937 RepID=UPI00265EE6F5|nr:LacI family DNA-binding transcriptional regulator [Fulvimonas sp. R45]MDO1528395.1 LacI family DNA-binding transcriptional regulator [Fulvimonas sp. R45]